MITAEQAKDLSLSCIKPVSYSDVYDVIKTNAQKGRFLVPSMYVSPNKRDQIVEELLSNGFKVNIICSNLIGIRWDD